MRTVNKLSKPSTSLSPRLVRKLTAILDWAILEKELDLLPKTSFDSPVVFAIKAAKLEDEILDRVETMASLGVSPEKAEEIRDQVEALLKALVS